MTACLWAAAALRQLLNVSYVCMHLRNLSRSVDMAARWAPPTPFVGIQQRQGSI